MTPEELTQMEALRTENEANKRELKRLKGLELGSQAASAVSKRLREAGIQFNPAILIRSTAHPVLTTEGAVDATWLASVFADFAADETGQVTGNGAPALANEAKSKKTLDDELTAALEGLGMPKEGMAAAVRGY